MGLQGQGNSNGNCHCSPGLYAGKVAHSLSGLDQTQLPLSRHVVVPWAGFPLGLWGNHSPALHSDWKWGSRIFCLPK